MKDQFKSQLLNNRDEILERWLNEVNSFKNEEYESIISDELFDETNKEFAHIIIQNISGEGTIKDFSHFTEKLINLGWPLSYVTDGLQGFRRISVNFILNELDNESIEHITDLLKVIDDWVDPIIHRLVNEYSGSWEQKLSLQRVALQELSAPLIPVMDNITVMPLVGMIDTSRARLIMENLLAGAIKHSAEVVLIDITGVPIVDTMVAHHIIQAAEAVRLIGSKCILVGIRPEIAQTIVSLGIDLNKFSTTNSLKNGFMQALEITDKEIISRTTKESALNEMIQSINKE